MLLLQNLTKKTLYIFVVCLIALFPYYCMAQVNNSVNSKYMGSIALDVQELALPNDITLGDDQSLMLISFGPDLAQRIMDNPIKYANPVRIWLSKSMISPAEAYFYVNKPSHEIRFTPRTDDLQTLILSGLADFSSTRKNMVFQKGKFYTLTLEINKMPTDTPAMNMPAMDVAMNPKTTYLFDEESTMDKNQDEFPMAQKTKWYKFAWVKPAVKNKYVKWGAGVVAISAASYFGYQQFSGSGGGNSLPLPPPPPQ